MCEGTVDGDRREVVWCMRISRPPYALH